MKTRTSARLVLFLSFSGVDRASDVSIICARQVVGVGPVDGVEFLPLDFSQNPDEYRHVDIILHKLSEDIMFR